MKYNSSCTYILPRKQLNDLRHTIMLFQLDWIVSFSMTALLTHTVVHFTRHSFRPKTNNHPIKNSISLEFTWAKILKLPTTFSTSSQFFHFVLNLILPLPALFSVLIWEMQLTIIKPFWKVRNNKVIQKLNKYFVWQCDKRKIPQFMKMIKISHKWKQGMFEAANQHFIKMLTCYYSALQKGSISEN